MMNNKRTAKIKRTAVSVFSLVFFMFATVALLCFCMEAVLCVYHFMHDLPTSVVEIICLVLLAALGGTAGLAWMCCDMDLLE